MNSKKNSSRFFIRSLFAILWNSITSFQAQAQFSGNPLFEGVDPKIHFFNNEYYINTTAVNGKQFHA